MAAARSENGGPNSLSAAEYHHLRWFITGVAVRRPDTGTPRSSSRRRERARLRKDDVAPSMDPCITRLEL